MLLALLCAAAALPTPPGRYAFRSYGSDEGLTNLAVQALEQDRAGFIWVGTEDGLFRYDGRRFQQTPAAALPSSSVAILARSGEGPLWVVTNKGVAVQDGDGFRTLQGLPELEAASIAALPDGSALVATRVGLFSGAATRAFAPLAGAPAGEATAVTARGGDIIVALAGQRLARRTAAGAWSVETAPTQKVIQGLAVDPAGRLWLRARESLYRQDRPGGPFADLSARLPAAAVYRSPLTLDAMGRLWIPTNLGLVVVDGDRWERIGEERGFPTSWTSAALVDREGSLWIASEGVHRQLGRGLWTQHGRKNGLLVDTVWSITRSPDGELWAGTNNGLARATAAGWEPVKGTEGWAIYALAVDPEGGVWAGGHPGERVATTLLHRSGSGAWETLPIPSMPGSSTINSMAFDRHGTLFIGTVKWGLFAWPKSRGAMVPLFDGKAGQIDHVLADAAGRVWVASEHGLLRWDGYTWTQYGREAGLVEDHVETLAAAPDGGIVLSYWNEHALSRFHAGHVTPLAAPAALTADKIYSLAYDSEGALWLGTALGAKRFLGAEIEQFGRGAGLPGEDCQGNAIWAEADGRVWIGLSNGLAELLPGPLLHPPAPPSAVLTAAVRGKDQPFPPGLQPILPYPDRTVDLRFAVLSFLDEARLQLQVRLVGLEDDWRDTDQREERYTTLPAGSYRFEVRARRPGGEWGPAAAQAFTIATPWFSSPFILGLFALLGGAAIAGSFRLRLRYLQRENERLDALVRGRTKALEEMSLHDPLTGLKNRRYLDVTMKRDVSLALRAARDGRPSMDLIFLLVDLDHFKEVNDTYGHAAGDLVLQQAAKALKGAVRESDVVVRWGGEEFLVVAQHSDRRAAEIVASHLAAAIHDRVFDLGEGRTLRRTCSIGFACFPLDPGSPSAAPWESIVELADRCLYGAKQSGRDAWVGVLRSRVALADLRARLSSDVEGVLQQLEVRSSLPPGRPIRWTR